MNERFWVGLGSLLVAAAFTGCAHEPQMRLQAEDEQDTRKDHLVKTIGDVSTISNADPVRVSGIGLVVNLAGTGGGAPPGGYRTILEGDLRKRGIENLKEVLNSSDTSLALVSAVVPAGARKDDPRDINITVPRESKTTSLRGGRLVDCLLYNYESSKNLEPNSRGPDRPLQGHPIVKAKGSLLVG